MQLEDLSSIWKTIVASFKYFDAPIGLAEGFEKEFIEIALKLGVFRLIFDGFDEFILWNRGTIDPQESLQELLNLADETDTALCITSRTSFWKAEIEETETSSVDAKLDNLLQFTISPFDANHAKNYFEKRFPNDKAKIEQSVQLFTQLKNDSSNEAMNFVGRGFFLSLIADLVSRGFVNPVSPDNRTRLQWIMDALCQREQIRQQLPLDSTLQLKILREFANFTAKGSPKSSSTLSTILELETNLTQPQIEELVYKPAKLKSHPLILYTENGEPWSFVQDQIGYALLAERVLELCKDNKRVELGLLLNNAVFLQSLQTEVATSLVQQIFETRTEEEALDFCQKIIITISATAEKVNEMQRPNGSNQFAGTLALLSAGKVHGRGSDRGKRTSTLLQLLPNRQLVGLQFVGGIPGLDLRDLTITNCNFDKVTFSNCRFSNQTKFINCTFTELRIQNCEQFGVISWDVSNRIDDTSRQLIDAEMIMAGRKNYTADDLSNDLNCLIRRFLPRETSGFKNIEERNLFRGSLGHSKYKDHIIESFKKHCCSSHKASSPHVYTVNEKAKEAFIFYVGNGIFTGELADVKSEISKKIGLI